VVGDVTVLDQSMCNVVMGLIGQLGTLKFGIIANGSTLDLYGPETSMNRCVH
jgi:hypothetical protein